MEVRGLSFLPSFLPLNSDPSYQAKSSPSYWHIEGQQAEWAELLEEAWALLVVYLPPPAGPLVCNLDSH